MKRFALLIEASEVPGEGQLPGARVDAENYHDWLYSKSGGDWFDSEIVVLHTPTVADVKRVVADAGKIDYAFVAFSGHGYHCGDLDQTHVCLRDGALTIRKLIPDADRCTAVVDACRTVMREELREAVKLARAEIKAYSYAERDYRKDFETQVSDAEKGAIFLYSCDLDEAAGEGRSGGYFSRSLINAGLEFRGRNTDGTKWLSMDKAFRRAAEMTTERNPQQTPQFEPGRRLKHFPLAV